MKREADEILNEKGHLFHISFFDVQKTTQNLDTFTNLPIMRNAFIYFFIWCIT